MEQVTEIPLKKITATQIIKMCNTALKVKIDENIYIGTEYFFLREDLVTIGYVNKLKKLVNRRELKENTFKDLADIDTYKCNENNKYRFFDSKHKIIVLETEIGDIGVNYNYYSYFKKRNLNFRFSTNRTGFNPIGMFKDNDFVGVILPIRIKAGEKN